MAYPVSWVLLWHFSMYECWYFNLFFLLCEGNNIDSLLYVLVNPIILPSIKCSLQFLCFNYWLHSWQDQFLPYLNYMNCLHLEGYKCFTWYLLFLVCTHHMFYSYLWCHGLVRYIFCVDLTHGMYYQYGFTHNLGTCPSFLNLRLLFYGSDTAYNSYLSESP